MSAAAALVLVPAPVAAHDRGAAQVFHVPGPSPRPDLKGTRLRCDGGPATFLIDPEGYRRGIPTAALGTKLFADMVKVEFQGCDSIPLAGYFSQDAYLARLSGAFDLPGRQRVEVTQVG
ncbi:hypothetical protein, partial [Actinoplanes philippinensis]|uniref:hypothetical protein n=1 Tax=Actinoplanes philippinensis TaxID=35752 RepID=UPI003403DA97